MGKLDNISDFYILRNIYLLFETSLPDTNYVHQNDENDEEDNDNMPHHMWGFHDDEFDNFFDDEVEIYPYKEDDVSWEDWTSELFPDTVIFARTMHPFHSNSKSKNLAKRGAHTDLPT